METISRRSEKHNRPITRGSIVIWSLVIFFLGFTAGFLSNHFINNTKIEFSVKSSKPSSPTHMQEISQPKEKDQPMHDPLSISEKQTVTTTSVAISNKETLKSQSVTPSKQLTSQNLPGDNKTELPPKPLLAIVIDDCGANIKLAQRMAQIKVPLTWAIMPDLRFTQATVQLARRHSIPFLIHMPMQAHSDENTRKNYLIGDTMSDKEVQDALGKIMPVFDGVYGLNNHRGSKATENGQLMSSMMRVLHKHNLLFLDSSTSSKSIAYKTACQMGLKTLKNKQFLDNSSDKEKIAHQFELACKYAQKNGYWIAIGHLRESTVDFFENYARTSEAASVHLVTIPELWNKMADPIGK